MTKLISLRVTVPTDDDVTTEALQLAMRTLLEAQPMSRTTDEPFGPRIHWSAVDVIRLVERVSAPVTRRVLGKKPPGQGTLPA